MHATFGRQNEQNARRLTPEEREALLRLNALTARLANAIPPSSPNGANDADAELNALLDRLDAQD